MSTNSGPAVQRSYYCLFSGFRMNFRKLIKPSSVGFAHTAQGLATLSMGPTLSYDKKQTLYYSLQLLQDAFDLCASTTSPPKLHPRWRHCRQRGVVVSGVRRMNEVNPRRARLVLGWVTLFGRVGAYTISVYNQPTRSTQPCNPPGSLNRVPASAGVRAGMSPLPGGR